MLHMIPFVIFSTRRLGEICRILWDDHEGNRVLVRAMNHSREKASNDVWCDLVPEAQVFIEAMPRAADRIFPFRAESVTHSFMSACKRLGIEHLRFHDLRQEGVSRLFEMGWNIPRVAAVSGHQTCEPATLHASATGWRQISGLEVRPCCATCFTSKLSRSPSRRAAGSIRQRFSSEACRKYCSFSPVSWTKPKPRSTLNNFS